MRDATAVLMQKMLKLYNRYRSFVLYVFFGVCTTIINIAAYTLCARVFGMGTVSANVTAWIAAVAAAYITNKIWVFESRAWTTKAVIYEIVTFAACRATTGAMDVAIMYVSVDLLSFQDIMMKVISNALVIVLNFLFSKLVIFKRK